MKQPSLFDDAAWKRAEYGRWIHHEGVSLAESRLATWLLQGEQLWLSSTEPACGKSHLLHEIAQSCPYLGTLTISDEKMDDHAVSLIATWMKQLHPFSHWAINIAAGAVDANIGEALFHLIERAKEGGQALLIVWHCPDADLHPAELASRLRMMEQVQIRAPNSDQDMKEVIRSIAQNYRWDLPEQIIQVMLSHTDRSLTHQIEALVKLEAESRPERVRTTQRWAREQLLDGDKE